MTDEKRDPAERPLAGEIRGTLGGLEAGAVRGRPIALDLDALRAEMTRRRFEPPRPGETHEQQYARQLQADNEAWAAWRPKSGEEANTRFFGRVDRTIVPARFQAGPEWRWYHTLAYRFGCWLEGVALRIQGWVP